MGKRLALAVTVMDESGEFRTYLPGEEPSDAVAENITNPAAWVLDDPEDRNDGGAWPPAGGLESMSDDEIFAAANSTSASTEDDDLNTKKATGDYDPSDTYQNQTVPQLRQLAEERDLDTSGLTRKQELIDLLAEDDARNG